MPMFHALEQSDVFFDACASDQHAQLLFLSVYGRDTSVQQLMARLHQPAGQGGIDALTLRASPEQSEALKVLVGDARRLEKVTGRIPKAGLLGNLVHAWIFDPKVLQVDHAARTAWLFDRAMAMGEVGDDPGDADRLQADTWQVVKELSPVPLMEAWRDLVLLHLKVNGAIAETRAVGPIRSIRVELPEFFHEWVSCNVREGVLEVPASVPAVALHSRMQSTHASRSPAVAA